MRKPGWEERLYATVADWRNRPFRWGSADCSNFALACVEAVRGTRPDIAIGRYSSRKGAAAALAKMNGTISGVMAAHFEECPVAMAGRGDIGVIEHDGAECAVVNTGLHWAGKSIDGTIVVDASRVMRAFRV